MANIADAVGEGSVPELREAISCAIMVKEMQPNSYQGRVESAWMHLNRRIMGIITECDAFCSR
ncbi:hypothetical protein FA10DRAFT_270013 [Acaromyces ingoldii]|uniref:Uncharacterized protein n=1 Tax=Acaromyces ingoldii TaxID=215250 RepID=A0A316YBK8_9BASI|nr:hypothetical protein FA10DRAFT_270013 [Acaromyces ingoldii]PWN86641.1 hypothetical protein FA10DRAFT_270013 [Acaromyces ingoldii]